MPGISILVSSIGQGGAEKVMADLAVLMTKRNMNVNLVVVTSISEEKRRFFSQRVNLAELNAKHYMSVLKPLYEALLSKKIFRLPFLAIKTLIDLPGKSLYPIVKYIRKTRPEVIFTAHYNSVTILANWLAGSPSKIVITEHTVLSKHFPSQIWFIRKFFPSICRFFYPKAHKIIGVSKFVADDMIKYLGLPPQKVMYIYNPIVGERLESMAQEDCYHPWFDEHIPVFIAVGRMSWEKDYKTLLEAFAIFHEATRARLLILGDGPLLAELQEYAGELKVAEDIDWIGFVKTPLACIKRADLFLLSSLYEGLPTVVIEALFVGTTVVVSDCGGVREVLNDGEYGYIVPVQSPKEMAGAMKAALENPFPPSKLRQRADIFSEDAALNAYCNVINRL
ncbi:glycosyl transferase [Synergistales bacterium]|nr:glycosyl transferase [Synergistales bacterium]